MNPPERVPDRARNAPPPPRRHDWRSLLDQAPSPSVPADFAARLEAQVDREAASARAEAQLMQVLMLVLVLAGTVFALPGLASGLVALVGQLGDALPAALGVACAIAVAWGVDLALRRPRGPLGI